MLKLGRKVWEGKYFVLLHNEELLHVSRRPFFLRSIQLPATRYLFLHFFLTFYPPLMSRIGKKPVAIPSGVIVEVSGSAVKVKGPKGELTYEHLPEVTVVVEGETVIIKRKNDTAQSRAYHGLTRQLIANMVQGVSEGYEKQLEIIGVGYKAQAKGKSVTLNLGYSHPIEYTAPEGVEISQDEKNKNILIIRGIDKQRVGQAAADIRAFRKPEPYKGKGVRYIDEEVRRKVGKAAVKSEAG